MADKCTAQLPGIRVSERLEMALMRIAARQDRTVSDLQRLILEKYCFGHAPNMEDEAAAVTQCNASQCDARKAEGAR